MTLALIDCNNFYVSCERVFNPKLAHVPLIVMSNNDGCAIARSDEVKALGIKMGAPIFQLKDTIQRHGIVLRSANFVLYGDMSYRVNLTLDQFSPVIERYSIDESFVELPATSAAIVARKMKQTVYQDTGIPTCVGLGPTKTLAKMANAIAKKNPLFQGVCDLTDTTLRKKLLPLFPVGDIWGVGHATCRKLQARGIFVAEQLRSLPAKAARECGTVVLERLVVELNGEPSIALELIAPKKKSIAVTRSFGQPIHTFNDIMEALAMYTARAAEKLRRDNLACGMITVFMNTSAHKGGPQHAGVHHVQMGNATDDTRVLLGYARDCAKRIYRSGFAFAKAGIYLDNLTPVATLNGDLFSAPRDPALMATLDNINTRFGAMKIHPASQGQRPAWAMRQAHLSPRYTTRITDVPVVRA